MSRLGSGDQDRRRDDISDFPIEVTRLTGIYPLVLLSAVGTAAYGISLMERTVSVAAYEGHLHSYKCQYLIRNIAYCCPSYYAICNWSHNVQHIHRKIPRPHILSTYIIEPEIGV